MDLSLNNKYFVVTGATSGFGEAVTNLLLKEGANLIVNARNEEKLKDLQNSFPGRIKYVAGDISTTEVADKLVAKINDFKPEGIFINAGGPAAASALDSTMEQWDDAYKLVLRWKVDLTKKIIPMFKNKKYGRIVFLESVSIIKPIKNLALSNSLRMAVAGFVKTMSNEVAKDGITLNIIAPGYHKTRAVERIIAKNADIQNISESESLNSIVNNIPVGLMGNPTDIAGLIIWLLSPQSSFVTGQTFTADGGVSSSFQ